MMTYISNYFFHPRDVQCISCDKDVVMRMDGVPRFKVETLPCTTSMKPYLTYELDQVRKQHRKLPHSRNMIQFEAAIQEEAKKQRSARAEALVKTPRYIYDLAYYNLKYLMFKIQFSFLN